MSRIDRSFFPIQGAEVYVDFVGSNHQSSFYKVGIVQTPESPVSIEIPSRLGPADLPTTRLLAAQHGLTQILASGNGAYY